PRERKYFAAAHREKHQRRGSGTGDRRTARRVLLSRGTGSRSGILLGESTMKRWLGALLFLASLAGTSRAQFLGYTTPQTVTQNLATNTACTGAAQTFTFPNLGQTQHAIIMQVTAPPMVSSKVFIEGSTNGVNFTRISDELDNINLATLTASGYYP